MQIAAAIRNGSSNRRPHLRMPETRTFASEQVDSFSAKAQALIGINWQPDECNSLARAAAGLVKWRSLACPPCAPE
jgi:hypothetical protein